MAEQPRSQKPWAIALFILFLAVAVGYVVWLSAASNSSDATEFAPGVSPTQRVKPSQTPRPTRTPKPTRTPVPTSTLTPAPKRVGVVAGHWLSDSGAVCDDGLEEVNINRDVAVQVVRLLKEQGYDAEVLPEFSDSLPGYRAEAFVSIHSDSCAIPGLSGFKVARVASSAIPDVEDRLVACLVQEYGGETGLDLHADTITYDMTAYHAFMEIDPLTPGAIIELGFMDGDRDLLTRHSDRAARGVAAGILCFLRQR